jgi:hypothetical protein
LKQQHDAPLSGAVAGHPSRKANQNGHVPIMPTQMTFAIHLGSMRRSAGLLNWQGIQLATEKNRRAGQSAVVECGNAVAAKTRQNPVGGQAFQFRHNARCGLFLFPGYFGRAMKLAPQFGQFHNISIAESWPH